ncbi:hypothetical protein CLOM_g18280 [Closterium sp. NIES-68]|nr:hypothetical protein CLOM_g18280 [Closterium sp. NIES-68]GJP63438.1 hypothetical protein CLOP_g20519 [Closterium sp. NIES-67]
MATRSASNAPTDPNDPTSPTATSSYSTASKDIYRRHGLTSPPSEPKVPASFPPGTSLSPSLLPNSPNLLPSERLRSPQQTSVATRTGSRLQSQYRPRQPSGSAQPDLSFRALVARHQYLLTTMAILAVLCTIYLYFAISMDDGESSKCGGLRGKALADCRLMLQVHRKTAKVDSGGIGRSGGLGRDGGGKGGEVERGDRDSEDAAADDDGDVEGEGDRGGGGGSSSGGRKAKVVYQVEE